MKRDYFNFIIIGSYKKSPEQLLGLHDFSHSLKYRSKIDFLVIFNESTCFSLIKILTQWQCQLAFQIDSSFNACVTNETKSIPKYVRQTSAWLRPTMSDMCWRAFEHSLQRNTGIWLKETENNKKAMQIK